MERGNHRRKPRPRASMACSRCRERKVRCNVEFGGIPCDNCIDIGSNCEITNIEAIRHREARRRESIVRPGDSTITIPPRMHSADWQLNVPVPEDRNRSASPSSSTSLDELIHHLPELMFNVHLDAVDPQGNNDGRNTMGCVDGTPQQNAITQSRSLLSAQGLTPMSSTAVGRATCHTLNWPGFLKPLSRSITNEDREFLRQRGALTIPDPELCNALLQSYIEFVHSFVPFLDLGQFLDDIEHPEKSSGQISLLFFQAVMFTASAFVDLKHLKNAGFASRKMAKKTLYTRVKLLYDLDSETDRIAVIQALLLMSYWYESPNDQKDNCYWIGIAISVAKTIGLNHNPARLGLSKKETFFRKRLWWSCYMRDRLVSLGMRRHAQIKDEDHDVPQLEMDDFELQSVPEDITCISRDCAIARDLTAQRQLAVICIDLAKLCVLIGQVLTASQSFQPIFSSKAQNSKGHAQMTMLLVPRTDNGLASNVELCDNKLLYWKSSLQIESRYHDPPQIGLFRGEDCTTLHLAMLHMTYFTVLSTLHRPQVLSMNSLTTLSAASMYQISRQRVRLAAHSVSMIAQSLHTLNLVKYLPPLGVTVMIPAAIILLFDMKSFDTRIKRTALNRFCKCMQVIQLMSKEYDGAESSLHIIEGAAQRVDIPYPKGFNHQLACYRGRCMLFQDEADIQDTGSPILTPSWGEDIPLEYPYAINQREVTPRELSPQTYSRSRDDALSHSLGGLIDNSTHFDQFVFDNIFDNPAGRDPVLSVSNERDENLLDSAKTGGEGSGILTEITMDWINGYLNGGSA